MEFEWDRAKQESTLSERGIDFEDMKIGFLDPERTLARDNRKDYGEDRYNMLAHCAGHVCHITFNLRGDVIRIISARQANKRERQHYGRG